MAKLLRTILEDIAHPHGTYVSVKPIEADIDKLYDWVNNNTSVVSNPKDSYHVTVIYSRNACPEVKAYDFNLPITGKITGWKKLGKTADDHFLVLTLESEALHKINDDLMRDYGATSDFPTYVPHISISYHHPEALPENYPAMTITFDSVSIEPLKEGWRPAKED